MQAYNVRILQQTNERFIYEDIRLRHLQSRVTEHEENWIQIRCDGFESCFHVRIVYNGVTS